MKKITSYFIGFSVFTMVLGGCAQESNPGNPSSLSQENGSTTQAVQTLGPLSYNTGSPDVLVNIDFKRASDFWTPDDLLANAQECGDAKDLQYYSDLLAKFQNQTIQVYNFKPKDAPQEAYQVLLVPNAGGYTNIENFKKDFDMCAAGGIYPDKVSSNWLVFQGACGGIGEDNPPPVTCNDIQTAVSNSLTINQ